MSNKTDTIYRCYGNTDTLKRIADNVEAGMTLKKVVKALGYKAPNVTKEIATQKRVIATQNCDLAMAYDSIPLSEFMEKKGIPYDSTLEEVNAKLNQEHFTTTTSDNYVMRGEVIHVDASKDYVDIESEDAWTEQQDFISALQLVFKDDDLFRIEYQCEEPGCEYYATNVEGALFGEYVADLNGDIEYCNTFYDLKKRVIKYVQSQEPSEDFSNVSDFDDLKAYCAEYEKQHENKYLEVHQFILDD